MCCYPFVKQMARYRLVNNSHVYRPVRVGRIKLLQGTALLASNEGFGMYRVGIAAHKWRFDIASTTTALNEE